ncbi:MAG: hypothetical protein WCJ30_12035 [Deltaproteobacteria bacterium]
MRVPTALAAFAVTAFIGRAAHAQNSWPLFHAVLATQRPLPCRETSHDAQSRRDEAAVMTFDHGRLATRTQTVSGGTGSRVDTYQYNAQGLLVAEDYRDGGEIIHVEFTYDRQGRPVTREARGLRQHLRIAFAYDQAGHLTRMDYDYDVNGTIDMVESLTYEGGRLAGFEQRMGGRVQYTERYFYEPGGRLQRMERDLAANGSVDLRRGYFYDARGRLAREENDRNADGAAEEVRTYRYDCGR